MGGAAKGNRSGQKRTKNTPPSGNKVQKRIVPTEIVEISSSVHGSYHKRDEVDDKSMITTLVSEVTALKASVNDLKQIVAMLAKAVYQQSPMLTPSGNKESPKSMINQPEQKSSLSGKNNGKNDEEVSGRKLFSCPTDGVVDFYTKFDAFHGINLGLKTGIKVPECIPVIYRPPESMVLNQVEAVIAAYIFADSNATGLDGKEILIRTPDFHADRTALKSLCPMGWIDQDILNLVVSMLAYQDRNNADIRSRWYLPTMFAQFAMSPGVDKDDVVKWYKDAFMGRPDKVKKIFIPINDENKHWYLAVVDIVLHQVIILDSLPCPSRKYDRKRDVRKVVIFLDELLLRPEFKSSGKLRLSLSEFEVIQKENVGQQAPGSNDCGVWVATWMTDNLWIENYLIIVNEETRVRLALDLMSLPYNNIGDEAIASAYNFWNKYAKI